MPDGRVLQSHLFRDVGYAEKEQTCCAAVRASAGVNPACGRKHVVRQRDVDEPVEITLWHHYAGS